MPLRLRRRVETSLSMLSSAALAKRHRRHKAVSAAAPPQKPHPFPRTSVTARVVRDFTRMRPWAPSGKPCVRTSLLFLETLSSIFSSVIPRVCIGADGQLQNKDGGEWRKKAAAANAVGVVASVLARAKVRPEKEKLLRIAVGALLGFAVEVDGIVDQVFAAAAKKAAEGGQKEIEEFCMRWLGVTTSHESEKFAAEPPA